MTTILIFTALLATTAYAQYHLDDMIAWAERTYPERTDR